MRPPPTPQRPDDRSAIDVVRLARAADAEVSSLVSASAARSDGGVGDTAMRHAALSLAWLGTFAPEALGASTVDAASAWLDDATPGDRSTVEAQMLVWAALVGCGARGSSAVLVRGLADVAPRSRRAAVDALGLAAPRLSATDDVVAAVFALLRDGDDDGPWALAACLCFAGEDAERAALYEDARRHIQRLESRTPLAELAVGWPPANARWLPLMYEGACLAMSRAVSVLPATPGQHELPVGGAVLDSAVTSRAARQAIYRGGTVPRLRRDAWLARMTEHPLGRPTLDRVAVPAEPGASDEDDDATDVTMH